MIDVVPNGNIFAEELFAHAASKDRALIAHRRGREIVKEEADQIEHRGRLENHGVMPCRNFERRARGDRFLTGAIRPALRDRCPSNSRELALAQPEESFSRIVIENSARVCS